MWVFTQVQDFRDWSGGSLDPLLADALLGGSEFLSTYLQQLLCDPNLPTPEPLRCNICDRQIQPWFFEKHTALCIVSHKSESEVQDCHDHLRDHRQVVAEILSRVENGHGAVVYNDLIINQPTSVHQSPKSDTGRFPSSGRSKAHKDRKPSIRYLDLILDYCDLAIDISTPAIPDGEGSDLFDRIQSPDSRSRISQLLEWNDPKIEDQALKVLYDDTLMLVSAKISAVTRLHNTIHYSEKIRQEIDLRVQDLIDTTAEGANLMHERDCIVHLSDSNVPILAKENADPSEIAHRPQGLENMMAPASFAKGLFREPFLQQRASGRSSSRSSADGSSPMGNTPVLSGSGQDQIVRATSSLSLETHHSDGGLSARSSLSSMLQRPSSSLQELESENLSTNWSRRNSPQDLEAQIRDIRIGRGIYDSPRRPSGAARPPTGFSPSRRNSRAVSRNRATSLARDRPVSPGRKTLGGRLSLLERDRLSPSASPTLSATDSLSTEASYKDRRVSNAPPLSPRLPSIAPAARPAPPSIKDFDIIKPISKGAFGSVYLSKKRTTGDYYAIKVLKKADMIAKNQVTNIKAERAIMMAQTESPFIAKLYFTFQSKEYLYLVMEYLNGGDCAALIRQLGGLPEDWAQRYTAEVVLGLEYLHSRGIIHRDLKPDNLLISHNGHLKLTDFGLSRVGLVGRQNRARTTSHPDTPDLLGSQKAISPTSSRSTSFDFQSGISTPAIAPMSLNETRSGYFNIRDRTVSHGDGLEAEPPGADTFSTAISKLSLEDSRYESDESTRSASSHSPAVHSPAIETSLHIGSSISSASQMPPPAMKLFDPKDGHKKFVGTPDYLAPETINGSGQDDMVDWWSLGVILFEFLYGYPPFHASSPDAVFQNILNRRIDWPTMAEDLELDVSDSAKDLMERLMALKPVERLGSQNGSSDVKAQRFFDGVSWETISEEEALFVPTPDHPEDTDYFDARGATNHVFEDESDNQLSSESSSAVTDKEKVKNEQESSFSARMLNHNRNVIKRTMMPLSIPPHVRDRRHRTRRSSESGKDDFGSFTFKNLSVLEKQNIEALKRLRSEHNNTTLMTNPKDQQGFPNRSPSFSGRTHTRRSASITSNLSSTPGSPVQYAVQTPRQSIPSSPLISSQSLAGSSSRHKSGGSISLSTGLSPAERHSSLPSSGGHESPLKFKPHSKSLPTPPVSAVSPRNRSFTVGAEGRADVPFNWSSVKRISRVFEPETPSSSSDNESSTGLKALQRIQRRRQRSKRLSSVSLPPEIGHRNHRPLDILICEDNPVSRRVLEAMLAKMKCRVVSVMDGAQAVAAATGDVTFDIIFTDIKVPRLSGIEVARLIRSSAGSNAETPIVAMSSYSTADVNDIAHIFEQRLEKPLTLISISETIETLVPDWLRPESTANSKVSSKTSVRK